VTSRDGRVVECDVMRWRWYSKASMAVCRRGGVGSEWFRARVVQRNGFVPL
jgi:hypothetical protein